jgi:HD-GYP domain-containing protein (c-di-GMP phosphodiesterase class II)
LSTVGWSGIFVAALLLAVPTLVTVAFRRVPQIDLLFESVTFHLVVVGAIASCALLVAGFTVAVASRSRQPEPVLLAMACLSIGFLMVCHGLTTPGVGNRPVNLWVARTPIMAVSLFAFFLISAMARETSALKRLVRRLPRASLSVVTVMLGLFSLVIVIDPTALSGDRPFPAESTVSHALLFTGVAALLVAGAVHWRRWRLGGDRIQLALVLACWLSVDAMISFELGHLWRLSWWDYHVYLLTGFAAAAWAVGAKARRSQNIENALSVISVTDTMARIERGHPEALHALAAAVEAKDRYTHGHSKRVAEISTRMGLRIGLDPDKLRGLARGALLHDVGKIGVPDQVLNKEGKLTDEEWGWIKAHPVVGWEVASQVPSLRDALSAVRHHHERWDGTGYPDHLGGQEIPISARIAAVADVWDALTSDRAYRAAWSPDRALDYVVASREVLFDPLCVEALIDIMAEQGLGPGQVVADPDALRAAAAACHPRSGRPEKHLASASRRRG